MKRLKLKSWVIPTIEVIALAIIVLVGVSSLKTKAEEEHQNTLNEYYSCIMEQHNTQGWIVRSACSYAYAQYDRELGLEYTQVGYDVYLANK